MPSIHTRISVPQWLFKKDSILKAIAIIPARYDSVRFPGKPLASLKGKPVIQHVYENARTALALERVVVATDNDAIVEAVTSFGGEAVMTSPDLASGTDRIADVANTLDYDIIVNVQGDEPIIRGEMIDTVVRLLDDKRASMGTLVKRIQDPDEIFDPNTVKAVFDKEGFAIYFSRSTIPYYRDEFSKTHDTIRASEDSRTNNAGIDPAILRFYKHIGIYSYRRNVLLELTRRPQSALEKAEKLEQLRALDNGYKIKVGETDIETIGVDTPEDLKKAEQWLNTYS
jgi:3-deoxy-manno-octulosonate cytidylyltransferase (CMP-KDO synthetase)